MVIDNLNLLGMISYPVKTYAPLIIDPDTILAGTISLQFFEAIPRDNM
jgi:hypothetical protein